MHEAAALADRVGIMDHGKLLALDTPVALMRSLAGESTLELTLDREPDADTVDALGKLGGVEAVEQLQATADGNGGGAAPPRVRLYLSGAAAPVVAPAAAALADRGLSLGDIRLGTPTLEDVFIHLTGRSLR
jgi:ABC-2 type transport system ATP-binding protein